MGDNVKGIDLLESEQSEKLWFPSNKQILFCITGLIFFIYAAKTYLANLPLLGLLSTIVLVAIPVAFSCVYHITIQKTISSLTYASGGFIAAFLSGRFVTYALAFIWSLGGSVLIICSLLSIDNIDFLVICIGITMFVFVYKIIFFRLHKEAALWTCYNRSLTWTKNIVICIVLIVEFVFVYLGLYDFVNYSSIQEALDSRNVFVTKSATINYISEISSIFMAAKNYWLGCLANGQGSIWAFILSASTCLATYYFYIVIVRVLFLPLSEIRRIFIRKCIPSLNIPQLENKDSFVYSFVFFICVFLFMYVFVCIDSKFRNESVINKVEQFEQNSKKVVYVVDGIFYRAGFYPDIEAGKKEFTERMESLDKKIFLYQSSICRKMEMNVDKFLDWYYSLTAEYLRIFNVLSGDAEEFMRDKLIEYLEKDIDFEELASKEQQRAALNEEWQQWVQERKQHYSCPREQAKSMAIVYLTPSDLQLPSFRDSSRWAAVGISGGIAAGIAAKALSKPTAKLAVSVLGKFLAKKGATLGASAMAGAASGAAAGSLIPGPGTIIGAASGAVASVAFWVAADWLFLSIEESVDRQNFRDELLLTVREYCQ